MGKARRFNQYDSAVKNTREGKQQSGLGLHKASTFGGSQSSVLIGQRGTGSGQNRDLGKLPLTGGLLSGSLGFEANSRAIVAGVLDLGKTLAGVDTQVKGIVFMAPETGDTDTLDRVTGKERDGQVLFLFGIQNAGASPTRTYTITHAGGGVGQILCPDNTNYVLLDDECVTLVDDVTATDTWRLISTSDANNLGGGGVTFPVDPVIKDFGTTSGTLALKLDASDTGDGHSFKVTMNGNVTLTFDNPPSSGTQHEFEMEFVQDGTGGRTVTHPASVAETVTIDSGASKTTIITYRTNDGGVTYHAIPALRGSISLSGTFLPLAGGTMTGDITMGNNDLLTVKDIQFQNGGTITAGTSMIVSDASGDMILNVATGDQIFLDINNVRMFQIGQIGGNNDSFAQITSLDNAEPLLKLFRDDSTMSAGAELGRMEFFSNDGGGVAMVYADITVDTENVTAANEAGSMHLGVAINGDTTTTTFLSLNNSDDDKITPWKNIHMAAGIDVEMVTNDIWLDEVADGTRISGTATTQEFRVGGTLHLTLAANAVTLPSTATLQIAELFQMAATAVNGGVDGDMWHDSGTGDVLVFSGGAERNLSNIVGDTLPFDDNQVIIQDEVFNAKTLTFNLSLLNDPAAVLLSFAVGGGRTHTFPPTGGTVAQLNLAQTWTAIQTFEDGNIKIGDAGASNTLLLKASGMTADKIATFPNNTGTVAELNLAQTWTADQTINADLLSDGLNNLGTTANPWNNIVSDNTLFCSNLKVFDTDSDINVFNDLDMQVGDTVDFNDNSASASAGANGDVPSQVVGYIQIKVQGVVRKVPFYAA